MEEKEIREKLKDLYYKEFGDMPEIKEIAGGGSPRKYFRLTGEEGRSVVGVYGEDIEENRVFIRLTKVFRKTGINVPEIIAKTPGEEFYLEEDLGDRSLFG